MGGGNFIVFYITGHFSWISSFYWRKSSNEIMVFLFYFNTSLGSTTNRVSLSVTRS